MSTYDLQEFEYELRRRLTDSEFGHVDWIVDMARCALEGVVQGRFLTTKQVAADLGVSTFAVRRMLRGERLPGRKRGGDWFIKASDLEMFRHRPKKEKPQKPKELKKPKKKEPMKMRFYIPSTYRLPR